MAELVEQRYAGALFEVSQQLGKEDLFLSELSFVNDSLRQNPDLMKVLSAPMISKNEKKDLVETIFSSSLSLEIINFLKILIDKGRIEAIFEIEDEFEKSLDKARNIKKITAIAAVELSEDIKIKLTEKLKAVTGSTVILNTLTDPSVIGGIMLKIGNEQIDGTVKGRLESLKMEISSIIA